MFLHEGIEELVSRKQRVKWLLLWAVGRIVNLTREHSVKEIISNVL